MLLFLKDENGQGMLEYVLIIALVALLLVGVLLFVSKKDTGLADKTNEQINKLPSDYAVS